MASEDVQTNIRLPADLKDRLVTASDAAGRSLSAEISQRLDESFATRAAIDNLSVTVKHYRAELEELRAKHAATEAALRASQQQAAKAIAEGDVIRDARATDIAAATAHLEQRVSDLSQRAVTAERAAGALQNFNSVLAHYVAMLADLVPAEDKRLQQSLKLLRSVGHFAEHGDLARAVQAANDLVGHGIASGILESDGKTLTPAAKASGARPRRKYVEPE